MNGNDTLLNKTNFFILQVSLSASQGINQIYTHISCDSDKNIQIKQSPTHFKDAYQTNRAVALFKDMQSHRHGKQSNKGQRQ